MTSIQNWFTNSKLVLNPETTNAVFFRTHMSYTRLFITQSTKIKFAENTKSLGILIDESSNFENHVDFITKKLIQAYYGLRILYKNSNINIIRSYFTVVSDMGLYFVVVVLILKEFRRSRKEQSVSRTI